MGEVTQSGSPVNSLTMTPYLSWPILFRTFIYIHYVLDLLSHKLAIYIYMDVEKKHHVLWVNRTEASLPVRNEDTMYL
jgi:hypothetical protein